MTKHSDPQPAVSPSDAPFTPRHKFDVLREVERLDPQQDQQRIAFLSATFDFPWDTRKAYELALLRTFAVPRSSQLLLSTGEFTERTQKRYDDTTILISTIGFYGYDAPEGRAAIRRMNQMHGRYQIPNDEFLYVLSTFVLEPLKWNRKYGWRALSENERQAAFYFWREVGRRMNIKDIPDTLQALEQFSLAYEQAHFAYSEANQRLAEVTRDLFLSWHLPRPLWVLGRPFVHAVMDTPMRQAFGFAEPNLFVRAALAFTLWLRKMTLKLTPPRRTPYTLPVTRTYPSGYELAQVGVH